MTSTPPAPQPDLSDLDDPIGGVYASGVASLFVTAAAEQMPAIVNDLCDQECRLKRPGGRKVAAYLAAERMWVDKLRRRIFRLVEQCPPPSRAAGVLYETEWYVRRQLAIVVFAAAASVIDGDRAAALAVGFEEAEVRAAELRAALLTVMRGESAIGELQGE